MEAAGRQVMDQPYGEKVSATLQPFFPTLCFSPRLASRTSYNTSASSGVFWPTLACIPCVLRLAVRCLGVWRAGLRAAGGAAAF